MKHLGFVNCSAWFTFSSQVLVKTFGEMWMRQGTHECRHSHSCAKTTRQSWNILVSFDARLIYRRVFENFKMRWEQVESVEDEMNVPFTLLFSSCLVLSRQECKPGIIILRKKSAPASLKCCNNSSQTVMQYSICRGVRSRGTHRHVICFICRCLFKLTCALDLLIQSIFPNCLTVSCRLPE